MFNTIEPYLHSLMPSEKAYLDRVYRRKAVWTPQSKPQWLALLSQADEIFYGGAAGGGKTDLLLGVSSECHHRSVIFRRVYPLLESVIYRANEIIGDTAKENKADHTWKWIDGRTLEFGAVQHESDKTKWQGRAHDFYGFDEIPEYTKSQYQFIIGWNRTVRVGQRTRVICTGNPPMDEAGSWIIQYWGAWLDDHHPNPAKPGELRWYATIDDEEKEFLSGEPFMHGSEMVYPRSRTFIPALLEDNVFLSSDNRYRATLQSLPEPMRSQMLYGNFRASSPVDPWQVIPTDWVRAAQRRWIEREKPTTPLSSVGLDPARGGRDNMALCLRYDNYFDKIIFWPGAIVKDGAIAAELVHQALGDLIPLDFNLDIGGIGSSAYDHVRLLYNNVHAIDASAGSTYRDKSKRYKMRNIRAEYYWRMRDALDPKSGDDLALPPGNEVVADLCSARYDASASGVLIEKKEEIKSRIGRSPDKGESILLAHHKISGAWVRSAG